jgi:polygalacturonase
MTRRTFIAAPGMALVSGPALTQEAIMARIKPPVFPERDFDITRYGAAAGGKTDCTEAIRKAIAACAQAGGGRVVVPAGVFLTGAIHLKRNVNLYVSGGATLLFSRDPKHYLPLVLTRFEGTECMNYSPFIYALDQTNIGISGSGILDGQADCDHWWPWKGSATCGWRKGDPNQAKARAALVDAAEKDMPVSERIFGEGRYLRPNFIQPYRSTNVLIEGVKIRNSPMWEVNPVLCRNVTVRNVDISTHGPNNDGCDPESSRDVLIESCTFDTGDDCIAIKSGRNRDGRRIGVPSENIIVHSCRMKDGHGGVSIGSEVSGGIRNVFVYDCTMDSPHLDRALRIKTNSYRGGVIENIFFRNVTIGQVANDVVQIDFSYEEGEGGPFQPVVRNVELRDVTCSKSSHALYLRGYASAPIRDVRVINCRFDNVAHPDIVDHVEGLHLDRVTVNGKPTG